MPTGAQNDVLPVRKRTKEALAAVKGDATYDQLLTALLAATPAEAVAARLGVRQERAVAAMARRRALQASPKGERRTASKQLLVASLAEERWRLWLDRGRVTRLGPRRYKWNATAPRTGGARIARQPGRGLADGEGPRVPR